MITSYEKLKIPDLRSKHDIIFEVNYTDDPEINNCQILKLTHPDGKESYIKREHLMAMLFAIGRPEDQRNLIPQRIVTARKYQTLLGITATKDIKRGEKINVKVDIPLPPMEQEIIEAAKKFKGDPHSLETKITKPGGFSKVGGLLVPNDKQGTGKKG